MQAVTSLLLGQVQDGKLAAVAVHIAGATTEDTTTGTNMSVGVPTGVTAGGADALGFGNIGVEAEGERQLKAVLPGVHG